jgi:hypothetical protein
VEELVTSQKMVIMSKNSFDVFNSLKRKSKSRYVANMRNKIRDRDMNKKDDMSYRSKLRMCPDISFGDGEKSIKKLWELCDG